MWCGTRLSRRPPCVPARWCARDTAELPVIHSPRTIHSRGPWTGRDERRDATMKGMPSLMPPDLALRIQQAGYYPELVSDTLAVALAGEETAAHLVHVETTFDTDTVRRHLSVLVLTPTRLVLAHVDDHSPSMLAEAGLGDVAFADGSLPDAEHADGPHAVATSEAIA